MNPIGNRPAFPLAVDFGIGERQVDSGITIREYFAAHAPEVPNSFQPTMAQKPSSLQNLHDKYGANSSHPHKNLFGEFFNIEGKEWVDKNGEVPEEFKKEVLQHIEDYWKREKERTEWEQNYNIQLFFQWRYYYADQMILFGQTQPKE